MSLNNDGVEIIEEGTPAPKADEKVPLSELISERKKRQDAEKRLKSVEETIKQSQEEKLRQQGELQELLKLKESELAEKESLVNTLKTKADAYDLLEAQERDEAKKKLGDKWDDDYNQIPIKTLRKIVNNFNLPSAIETDNGGGSKPKPETLTDAEQKEAQIMGLSEDAYLAFKKKRQLLKEKK